MEVVNIHDAKTRLSQLIARAVSGNPFIIAKSGKPLVKVTSLEAPTGSRIRRLGFLTGQIEVPDDFDTMGSGEIEGLFGGCP